MNLTVGTNSWATVEQANTYFKTRLFAGKIWNESLSEPDKEAALVTAYNQLTTAGLFNLAPDDTSENTKKAQFEMAFYLLQHLSDSDSRKGLQAQGVQSAGIVQESYDMSFASEMPIPANVKSILKDSLIGSADFGSAEISRDDLE